MINQSKTFNNFNQDIIVKVKHNNKSLIISNKYKSDQYDDQQIKIKFLVLHYTELDFKETIEYFQDKDRNVSSHYVVDLNGDVYNFVSEHHRSYHAGYSFWRGIKDINNQSIGIEIVNDGKSLYSYKQIDAVIILCQYIIEKYSIEHCDIVGHSDISPYRKVDPGIFFPWKQLSDNGIGVFWSDKIDKNITMNLSEIKSRLAKIGYQTDIYQHSKTHPYKCDNKINQSDTLNDTIDQSTIEDNNYLNHNNISLDRHNNFVNNNNFDILAVGLIAFSARFLGKSMPMMCVYDFNCRKDLLSALKEISDQY